jgi:hypothetical protein
VAQAFAEEHPRLLPLPLHPFNTDRVEPVRSRKTIYVHFDLNDYSRVISDNGPQFIAKDFKEFIRISGMTHVRTSQFYPQSNGKIERWHKSLKAECIRPGTPLSLHDARRLVQGYVDHYNNVRLQDFTLERRSAFSSVSPS